MSPGPVFGGRSEAMPQIAQDEVDILIERFARGLVQTGKGTRSLGGQFFELRSQHARVIIKNLGEGHYDIVAKFESHDLGDTKNSKLIDALIADYKRIVGK